MSRASIDSQKYAALAYVPRVPSTDTKWPHGESLRRIRGALSAEKAARKIDVTRDAWAKWERGERAPSLENLRLIVESFGADPKMVGYEAPEGWELVPSDWVQKQFAELHVKLDKLLERS